MARGYVPLLLLVAGIWGASFMFIKVAVEEIEPIAMIHARLLISALTLAPVLLVQHGARAAARDLRAAAYGLVVLGIVNAALPFTLIAWGEKHIDSGIAAIANAPVPIFVVLLALKFKPSERATGLRLVGIVLGFSGVAVLAGFNPDGGWWAVAATMAVVAASLCYAAANLFAQARFSETNPLVIVVGSSLAGAALLTPLAIAQAPHDLPSWKAIASLLGLSVLGTAVALVLYYRMLAAYGASRASLVTYLVPLTALVYGTLLLDEPLTANAVGGLVLILGGVALGSGIVRLSGRGAVVPAAPRP